MRPITLHMLARRLASVRRDCDVDGPESTPVVAEIDGRRMWLTTENFQLGDDGTLFINTGAGKTEQGREPI